MIQDFLRLDYWKWKRTKIYGNLETFAAFLEQFIKIWTLLVGIVLKVENNQFY